MGSLNNNNDQLLRSSANFISALSSKYHPGIGPELSVALVKKFTTKGVLDRLKNGKTDEIGETPGIGKTKAEMLVASYVFTAKLLEFAQYLDESGFRKTAALKLFAVWGKRSLKVIQSNPYVLLCVYDWKEVDSIGLKLANKFHPCRVIGAIEWCLYRDYEEDKNTCIDHQTLSNKVMSLINCDKITFERGLQLALKTNTVISHLDNYQSPSIHWYERILERHFLDNYETNLPEKRISLWIDNTEHSQLTHEQKAAVKNALRHRISAYCGRGGRGKTWTLTSIIAGAKELLRKDKIYLAAVASIAVQRMQKETGHDPKYCCTIARLIHRIQPEDLRGALIFIDEASMLSLVDTFRLFKKIPYNAHIVFLGDQNQISSIDAGKIFYDLINSEQIPSVELTISQRFDQKTDQQLEQILEGKLPKFEEYYDGCGTGLYVKDVEKSDRVRDVIDYIENEVCVLYENLLKRKESVQIISPLRDEKNKGSSEAINTKVHTFLHGEQNSHNYVVSTPVVWTKNYFCESGVFLSNGSRGKVIGVHERASEYRMKVQFELEGDVYLKSYEVKDYLDYAYCLSVHRAQGSEWENVIVVLPTSDNMINRNMVYTAMSRCKKRSIVLYDNYNFVSKMVGLPAEHKRRKTLLLKSSDA